MARSLKVALVDASIAMKLVAVDGAASQDFLWLFGVDVRSRANLVGHVGRSQAQEIGGRLPGRVPGANQNLWEGYRIGYDHEVPKGVLVKVAVPSGTEFQAPALVGRDVEGEL